MTPTTATGSQSRPERGILQYFTSRVTIGESGIGYLTGGVLASCIVFGGATRSGSLGDVVLQFVSLILFIAAVREIILSGGFRHFKWPLIFAASMALVPVIQLLPLPASAWTMLPGHALISETYVLIHQDAPSLPITMSPMASWLSALAMLPPMAIFLATLTLNNASRRNISYVVIAMGIGSMFLGLLQLAQGPNSALRFYEITNRMEAVGFFANRNHFAALLYVTTLLVAVHFVEAIVSAARKLRRRRTEFNTILPLVTWFTALVMLTAAQMMARSRAGLVLTALALLAAAGLGMSDRRLKSARLDFGRSMVISIVIAMIFFLPLALYRAAERFGTDPHADARIPFARNTVSAALAYMPFGSGLGTFVPVYQLFEKTSDVGIAYANHAHNDVLEVWLETGVLGLALMSIFGVWTLRRAASVWREDSSELRGTDRGLVRSASVAVLLLLAHSLVDYPLRTTAMMAVIAMATGFLVTPPKDSEERENASDVGTGSRRVRRIQGTATGLVPPRDSATDSAAARRSERRSNRPRESWTQSGDGPEAWRR